MNSPNPAGAPNQGTAQTVDEWIEEYRRDEAKCNYMAAGVAALLVFGGFADKLFAAVPTWLRAVFIVTALAAGLCIALSKIAYQAAATKLDRSRSGFTVGQKIDRNTQGFEFPSPAPRYFRAGAILLIAAGAVLITAAVWAAIKPVKPDTCTVQWNHKNHSFVCGNPS